MTTTKPTNSKSSNLIHSIIIHIRYPYTALIIAILWIGIASIISHYLDYVEVIITVTAIITVIIAFLGFRNRH